MPPEYIIRDWTEKKAKKHALTIFPAEDGKTKLEVYDDKGLYLANVGALGYLDYAQYLDMEKLMATAVSHKALVMKWAQQNHKVLRFDSESQVENRNDLHSVSLVIDEEIWFTEVNHSRKKAEELCSEKACRKLGL